MQGLDCLVFGGREFQVFAPLKLKHNVKHQIWSLSCVSSTEPAYLHTWFPFLLAPNISHYSCLGRGPRVEGGTHAVKLQID